MHSKERELYSTQEYNGRVEVLLYWEQSREGYCSTVVDHTRSTVIYYSTRVVVLNTTL
jgi:hypothetical protein